MAVTVKTDGEGFYLAGNPIIVEVTTSKTLGKDESFLRVVLEGTLKASDRSSIPAMKVELSQPVPNKGTAVFNLSDAVQGIVSRIQAEIDMNDSKTEHAWFKAVRINGSFKCKDVWIRDNVEQTDGMSSEYTFVAVPGKKTDYELLMENPDSRPLLSSLVTKKPMSRKPDMGIVYNGETVILPMVSVVQASRKFQIFVGADEVAGYTTSGDTAGYTLFYNWSEVNHSSDGELTVKSSYVGTKSGYFRTNTNGVHFLRFINGFGAVENIAVRAKDKLTYEVSGETHSLVQGISTRPSDRRYASKSQPVGVYELSSGYVPKKWAEWYVQELLTSPRVWIQLAGKWVPALIEAEDDCVIYDRTKPEMPHVDFTLRLAIDGVTGVTW
jgi:hypothetical protein